ncbi:hypothetical protein LEM8419_03531 [Neolewinella maritima]|uniref:Uncharacterized protein n=1 Tax=Neolewinella maritima TaxID=1383882 RepID=A0ABM9B614_9BACT|nr:hypothetical protein [Neolewinella maritima]CAH1002659.1 hypothetical protein LEM8419_03531 [Neolewinella maritima]
MQELISPNGAYGIDGILAVIDTANILYDGYKKVSADGKVDVTDAGILFTAGPALMGTLTTVVSKAADLDDEFMDRSDDENAQILARAGQRIDNATYKKILSGLITLSDGIAELIKTDTPTA